MTNGDALVTASEHTTAEAGFGSRGQGIEVEVWELPAEEIGGFLAAIPAPLGIGTVHLQDGSAVRGFICESHAVVGADDITRYGGWRAYTRAAR